jgi:hypothetical protein
MLFDTRLILLLLLFCVGIITIINKARFLHLMHNIYITKPKSE